MLSDAAMPHIPPWSWHHWHLHGVAKSHVPGGWDMIKAGKFLIEFFKKKIKETWESITFFFKLRLESITPSKHFQVWTCELTPFLGAPEFHPQRRHHPAPRHPHLQTWLPDHRCWSEITPLIKWNWTTRWYSFGWWFFHLVLGDKSLSQ